MKQVFTSICILIICMGCVTSAADLQKVPEPGPEDHGLRLRLIVKRELTKGDETFKVRVDLINTTEQPITLTAAWPHDNMGDFRKYLEACIWIESFPVIGAWLPQIRADYRTQPQPKLKLPAKGVVTVEWQTKDRRLKNKGLRYSQPRRFPADGLYSIHANALLRTDKGECILRSNEQLVPIGGSKALPKHSVGRVVRVDAKANIVTLNLGTLHKIAVGDKFAIRIGMGGLCRMEVNRVGKSECSGKIVSENLRSDAKPRLPRKGDKALLQDK